MAGALLGLAKALSLLEVKKKDQSCHTLHYEHNLSLIAQTSSSCTTKAEVGKHALQRREDHREI